MVTADKICIPKFDQKNKYHLKSATIAKLNNSINETCLYWRCFVTSLYCILGKLIEKNSENVTLIKPWDSVSVGGGLTLMTLT